MALRICCKWLITGRKRSEADGCFAPWAIDGDGWSASHFVCIRNGHKNTGQPLQVSPLAKSLPDNCPVLKFFVFKTQAQLVKRWRTWRFQLAIWTSKNWIVSHHNVLMFSEKLNYFVTCSNWPLNCFWTMLETAGSFCNDSLSSSKLRNKLWNSWASSWMVVFIFREFIKEIGFTQL